MFCLCGQGEYGEMIGCYNPAYSIEWFHIIIYLRVIGCALFSFQKAVIKDEIKILESVCDKGIRSGSSLDSYDNMSPSLFKEILEEVNEKCPLVHGMLEALVISNPVSHNILKTNEHKMLCGLQTLGFICNMRNSKTKNCFPLMFGLLRVSYGAGKQFIDMLQSMGFHYTGTQCKYKKI